MLIRSDPFRELDRVAQQILGTRTHPAGIPRDAYREGDQFVVRAWTRTASMRVTRTRSSRW
jgi:hypothetical protein